MARWLRVKSERSVDSGYVAVRGVDHGSDGVAAIVVHASVRRSDFSGKAGEDCAVVFDVKPGKFSRFGEVVRLTGTVTGIGASFEVRLKTVVHPDGSGEVDRAEERECSYEYGSPYGED